MKRVILALAAFLVSTTTFAFATVPVPISEDYPLRLGATIKTSAGFSPFAIQDLTGIVGIGYAFGGGFEGGFQIRSGGTSKKLFANGFVTTSEIGGDLVLRYLGTVGDAFYLGFDGRFGYDYTFGLDSITNASSVTASVGIPFGFVLSPIIYVYAEPLIEFGHRATAAEGAFGSLVGFGSKLGVLICLGSPKIFLEFTPKTLNISNKSVDADRPDGFVLDAMLGMAFEM